MATSITTIQSTDLITNSRADINNNFDSLLNNKIETDVLDTDTTLAANSDLKVPTQKAVKAYVDAGGNVNASTTNKGIVEEATDAEALAGTATGGTGARLFVSPSNIAALKPVTRIYEYADSPATWSKPTGLHSLRVQVWGGGGSGGACTSSGDETGGGGGGGYAESIFSASVLGTTETITIGAGGTAVSNADGNIGGNTTFGSLLTGYGGGGGARNSSGGGGGGGGGWMGAGGNATTEVAGVAGIPTGFGGAGGDGATGTGGTTALCGGGGGAGGASGGAVGVGGTGFYGGGGGGGANNNGAGVGGSSILGGVGGAGLSEATSNTGNATSGSVPGGGGGAKHSNAGSGNSGAGGNGRCIVTEYYV